jgi:HAE1 family hydrophobic/amphiphilic exporter-1
MVILIVVILGIVSLLNLKLELMPQMDLGVAIVTAEYDGAGPEEIENLVTRPLEDVLNTVSNLEGLTSTSSDGRSLIVLEFSDGTDMDSAALKIRENVDLIKDFLPDGVEPHVMQIDPSVMDELSIGVTGQDGMDLVQLRNILDDEVIKRLEKLEGVGSISVSGGMEREISVELFPDKLANYGVSSSQIAQLLAAENINLPGGDLSQGEFELQIRTTGEFQSVAEIEAMPVTTPRGVVIRLGDLARVTDGFKKVNSYAIINGGQGIMLSIAKQSTANTVEVAERVVAEIDILRQDFPELDLALVLDTSGFIKSSVNNVWNAVFQATLLASIVLLVFLGGARTSLIIGVAIPISIIGTLGLMYFAGLTLNMVTLMALLISVGMLVDNSIVVLECITRHIQEGKDPKTAAVEGAQEVGISVVASTLTTVIVFVPVMFVSGIAGEMFGQLGLVLTFALMSSLVVSLTFVPMACSKFLKPETGSKKRPLWDKWSGALKKLETGYSRLLRFSLTHRPLIVVLFVTFVVVTASVFLFMGMEFLTAMDQGYVQVSVSVPVGSRLEEVSAATDIVLERIENIDGIQEISVTVGSGELALLTRSGGASSASIIAKLTPKAGRRSINAISEDMRAAIGTLTGAECVVSNINGASMLGMGGETSVTINVFSDDLDILRQTGGDIVEIISALPMLRNAESSIETGLPQARVVIDRNKASSYGLQASAVAATVSMAVNGSTVTKYKVEGDEIDVVMRYDTQRLNYLPDLENLVIMTPAGASVPLFEVAEIINEEGVSSITKDDRKRYISVTADFLDYTLSEVTEQIDALLADYEFQGDSYYEYGGSFVTMMESFSSLLLALLLGFVMVYMVIAAQFESLAYPGTILFSIPVSWAAGLVGLFFLGQSVNIISLIGLILLMGIVVNNGIVLVDYINIKRKEGLSTFDAIMYAAPVRLRPILMTTITTVVGMLPMLFGKGEGSELQVPMGAVIIFGLSIGTFVTLLLIPVLYLMLHNLRKKLNTDKVKL